MPRATACSSMPCPRSTISSWATASPCRRCARRASPAPSASPTCIPRSGPRPGSVTDRFLANIFDLVLNRVYADPILLGRYPKLPLIARPWFRSLGKISDADLRTIHQPLDFYGLNYYYPVKVATGRGRAKAPPDSADAMLKMPFHMAAFPEYATTGFGWPVAPDHLGTLLRELKDRYGAALPPLYITESGASFPEPDHVSGPIADAERISYIASHLGHAVDATAPGGIAEDVELLGYYVWTLMDNFEWAAGYSQRFGLVHVDFDTQERTPKDSYYWYQALSTGTQGLSPAGLLVPVGPVNALGALDLVAEVLLGPKDSDDDGNGHQQENQPAHCELPSLEATISAPGPVNYGPPVHGAVPARQPQACCGSAARPPALSGPRQ